MSGAAVAEAAKPAEAGAVNRAAARPWINGRAVVMTLYLVFLMLPIYWLLNMSLKTNTEITTGLTLWPREITFENYIKIFTDPSWYGGYINSLTYVLINTVLSIALALPAAYAFSRYRFLGDKHLFFWLLSNRMAPPAVFALPFFNLYSAIGLFDTPWAVALAHCLFNVPLAVWILEGFMSGVPREIDETAAIDGYSFPRFFMKIFMPLIASGIGVAAFFCFMFSWVELLLARTLTTVERKAHRGDHDPHGLRGRHGLGPSRRRRRAHHPAGRARDLVRAQLHRQGLRPGEGVMPDLAWMAWTWQTGIFFAVIVSLLLLMTALALVRPETERVGILRIATTRGDRLFVTLLGAAFIHLAWLGLVGPDLWSASGLSLLYAAAVFRFV